MKNVVRQIVSGIIAVCMMLTILPVSVFATDDEDDILSEWLLSDSYYDEEDNCFVLTDSDKTWVAGAIWYNTPVKGDFQLELDYYTGLSDTYGGREHGADGIAVAFYTNYAFSSPEGKEMGFSGPGYGIELDTNCNPDLGDPSYNHISLIKGNAGNHLIQAELPESEDDMWHHLEIRVEDQICYAYIDGSLKLSYEIEETGYNYVGISASTGIFTNKHAVKNIVITADSYDENNSKYLDLQLSHQQLTDSDGFYAYEITATIENTAETTAKNLALIFQSESALSLTEDSNNEILIGDLPPGAKETASWEVTARWPEENSSAIYSVIADIDNHTVMLKQENYIYLVSKNQNDNSFKLGIDQWNFYNIPQYFTNGKYEIVNGDRIYDDDYYLTDNDYDALLSNLSNLERYMIDTAKNSHWGGSCYGMSATAILAKMEVVDPHFMEVLGTTNLYDVPKSNDDKVESFINFYQLQQFTKETQNNISEFSLKSTAEQLKIIEEKAEAVLKGGSPFILSFSGDNGGHAVVGYGVEHKENILDSLSWKPGYDSRILIYDCNNPNKLIYLYYNTGTDEWCIPEYNKTDKPSTGIHATKLIQALDDLTIIDSVNYDTETRNRYARILFESYSDLFYLKQENRTIEINGTTDLREEGLITFYDMNITADGETTPGTLNLVLPSLTESYTVEPVPGEPCKIDMVYENEMLTASVDNAESIHFSPNSSVSATKTTGEFQLSICADEGSYDLPWYLVSVSGQNSDEISLKKVDNGILVSGTNLDGITVTSEDTEGNIQKTHFSAEGTEAIIQADQKEDLIVKEDLNNDGEYETVVSGQDDNEEINVTDVSLNSSSISLTVGETYQLEAIVMPTDATDKTVIWTSSNPDVATVNSDGLVTAVSNGTTIVTVKTTDGQKTTTCIVSVRTIFDHNSNSNSSAYVPNQEPEYRWVHTQNGFRLYFGSSRVTGWYQDEETGAWYWLDTDSGMMAANQWVKIDGVWYWFQHNGIMQTGWLEYDDNWYYLKDWGGMATGWQYIDGNWYYFKDWGGMATGWQYIDSTWYYLYSSGVMAANSWIQTNGSWYYLTDSGAMAVDQWVEWKGNWYYLYSSGVMATNAAIDGYYVNANGVWVR